MSKTINTHLVNDIIYRKVIIEYYVQNAKAACQLMRINCLTVKRMLYDSVELQFSSFVHHFVQFLLHQGTSDNSENVKHLGYHECVSAAVHYGYNNVITGVGIRDGKYHKSKVGSTPHNHNSLTLSETNHSPQQYWRDKKLEA